MGPIAEDDGSNYKNDSFWDNHFADNVLKQYSPSKCEAASINARNVIYEFQLIKKELKLQGIFSAHLAGIISLQNTCNGLNKKSPITMDECEKFYAIYGSAFFCKI